ncbi:hypothetical protein [Microbacterium sp. 8M]|uniref:hypothetical protein n=1 Tax=Microbacterium sp. 8M TaxID=2653153 RepID=UPI00135B2A94|nr:hypothetical protein [Microbacterium sp. 8M]
MTDISATSKSPGEVELVESGKRAIQAADSISDEPIDCYFGRFGTFFLDVGHSKKSRRVFHEEIVQAIRSDSRVTEVADSEFKAVWTRTWTSFPPGADSNRDQLLSGSDHFHPLELSEPVAFAVHVPIKNQPVILDADDVPTDQYWAVWDGLTLVVIWKRQPESRRPPRSAGHVVEEIIRAAAERTGARLVVQACSPGCTNMFAHRSLRIDQFREQDGPSMKLEGSHPRVVSVRLHRDGEPMNVATTLYERIEDPCGHFARLKNLSRRIIDIEGDLRQLVDELLAMDYARLARSKKGWRARASYQLHAAWHWFRGEGAGRETQELIGSIWIAMARIERLRRDWLQQQRRFSDAATLYGRQVLFDIDRIDDEVAVSAMDTGFAKAAVEHKSARRDSKVIVWATVGGGVAGGAVALLAAALSSAA